MGKMGAGELSVDSMLRARWRESMSKRKVAQKGR